MRRTLTKAERAHLVRKLEKYERMCAHARRSDACTIAEVSLIVRRLVSIRETLERGWTVAERGRRLYE